MKKLKVENGDRINVKVQVGVKEFIEEYLGPEGLKKAVVIMATGDESALLRKRAAYTTMAVSEFFRDQAP